MRLQPDGGTLESFPQRVDCGGQRFCKRERLPNHRRKQCVQKQRGNSQRNQHRRERRDRRPQPLFKRACKRFQQKGERARAEEDAERWNQNIAKRDRRQERRADRNQQAQRSLPARNRRGKLHEASLAFDEMGAPSGEIVPKARGVGKRIFPFGSVRPVRFRACQSGFPPLRRAIHRFCEPGGSSASRSASS